MNEQGIQEVLRSLGCRSIRRCGDHIRANCPLAPFTHKKGTDRNPSFFVKIENGGRSCYHCFSCGSKGTLTGLLYDLQRYGGFVEPTLLDKVKKAEKQNPVEKAKHRKSTLSWDFMLAKKRYDEEMWAEEDYLPYAGQTHRYILNRGVSLDTCRTWEIGYDSDKRRIVFPVRRFPDSALVGAVGRTIDQAVEPSYLTYFNFKKSNFLYGEHLLKEESEPVLGEAMGYDLPGQRAVILVEGMMDVLKLYEMGYENVVGLMTATVSRRQISTLKRIGRDVYLMLDWDEAGMSGRVSAVEALKEKHRLYDVPGVRTCSSCGSRWMKLQGRLLFCRSCGSPWEVDAQKKDPDSLEEREILDCLQNAKRIGISS